MKLSRLLKLKCINRLKSGQGFSLVELMVVVAIIGILAAIAIPNYQRFQRKARQSEAKGTLGGIYTAQRTFITEWGFGTNNLRQSGFSPDGEMLYNVGFVDGTVTGSADPNKATEADLSSIRSLGYRGPVAANVADFNSINLCGSGGSAIVSCTFIGKAAESALTRTVDTKLNDVGSCNDSSKVTQSTCTGNFGSPSVTRVWTGLTVHNTSIHDVTFTAGAAGDIGGNATDEWFINNAKRITNIQDGSE